MQIVTLRIKVPRNQRKYFLEAAQMVIGPTKVQPGCISCRFYQDVNDPDYVFLMEEWQTREALDHHMKSEQYRIILSLVDSSKIPPELKIRTISKPEGLEAIEAVRVGN